MAGPTCSVLLPRNLDEDQVAEIAELVADAGWARHDRVLLASVAGVEEGPDFYELAELQQIESAFGWRPSSQIVCVSMIGSDPKYHRLLAQGALALAQRFNGVINLFGTLSLVLDGAGERAVVTYTGHSGQDAATWVVDPPYLAAWIDHPWFRMAN